jgi:uncharacterized protein YndB with AHSA1/START domain
MTDRIERSVELKAPIDRVWRALTDHREFGAWFLARIDAPFAVGEESTGQMTYPGYEHFKWTAAIVAMEAPTRFAFAWPHADEHGVDYADEPRTLVEFRLEPSGAGTRLTVTESGFDRLSPERRARALESNSGGWDEQMRNIAAYVDG